MDTKIDAEELSQYIRAVIDGISKGIPDTHIVRGGISFELAIINTKEGKAGLRIYVAEAGGKYREGTISRIRFEISKKDEPVSVGFVPSIFNGGSGS